MRFKPTSLEWKITQKLNSFEPKTLSRIYGFPEQCLFYRLKHLTTPNNLHIPPGFWNVSFGDFLETNSIFQGFVWKMNSIIWQRFTICMFTNRLVHAHAESRNTRENREIMSFLPRKMRWINCMEQSLLTEHHMVDHNVAFHLKHQSGGIKSCRNTRAVWEVWSPTSLPLMWPFSQV